MQTRLAPNAHACFRRNQHMAYCMLKPQMSVKFRSKFILEQSVKNWFPGHMFRGMKDIMRMLKNIDCIIEIHDARVPFTGRNTRFQTDVLSTRPHLLIQNKADLADTDCNQLVIDRIQQSERISEIMYTNLKNEADSTKKIISKALRLVRTNDRFQREDRADINLLVIGIPNVGKSTFINRIRQSLLGQKKAVAKVGDQPGVTRTIQERIRISIDPLIYIYDTPGILQPNFHNKVEDPLKLAACGLLPNDVIGREVIADFILYWLNKQKEFDYANIIGLNDGPTDSITEVLYRIAINENLMLLKRLPPTNEMVPTPNVMLAATRFITMFQENQFGKFVLDKDLLRC